MSVLPNAKLARVWEEELYLKLRRDRFLAWCVSGGLFLVLLALLLFSFVRPAQEVYVPYVFTVDRQTGYVEQVTTLERKKLTESEAINKANIAKFVILRETYDPPDVVRNYHLVNLFTAEQARDEYARLWDAGNPQRPNTRYGYDIEVQTVVKSVSFLNGYTANVRFKTITKSRNAPEKEENWVAVLTYRYVSTPQKQQDMFENPLGFQVTSYRKDQETL